MSGSPLYLEIADRQIGPERPCYVIAEAGVNHNGDLQTALKLVDVAVEAGADAVKFQTFKADALATEFAPKAKYQAELTGDNESQLEMLRRLELRREDHQPIIDHCRKRGITFLSTPFDDDSAAFLVSLGVPALKVSSGDLTNIPFLRNLAVTGLPILLSTGMGTIMEVEQAVTALRATGCRDLGLFHCVSCYPALAEETNLRAIGTLSDTFGVPTGLSDHTAGLEISLAAVALGAQLIEKHFTLDRSMPGPDHLASLEPTELADLVRMTRSIESAFGNGQKAPQPRELDTAKVARKGVVAARQISQGAVITRSDLAIRRPENGLRPIDIDRPVGHRALKDIPAGTAINPDDFSVD